MIDEQSVRRYRTDGYLLVPGALTAETLTRLRCGVERLIKRWRAVGDSYERVLHQIHHPWRQDPDVAALVTDVGLADAASRLASMPAVSVFLDQVIVKPPGGLATIAHQDAPFLSFDDDRSLGCWIALDQVTTANGALSYFQGSNRLGPLPRVHLDEDDRLPQLVPQLRELPLRTVEMAPGDVVFHNCLTVHQASANGTDQLRRAFSLQYMPVGALYNGYDHDFLTPYAPAVGEVLDQPCFAVPGQIETSVR